MQYWWVNHRTSYKRELAGGYIWCPQVGDGDRRRESWEVMQLVKPGDLVVSHARQAIQAVGIAQSAPFDSPPRDGYAANGWNQLGWEVPVLWTALPDRLSPKERIAEIAEWLPNRYSPLKPNGDANMTYLHRIEKGLADWILAASGLGTQTLKDEVEVAEIRGRNIPAVEKLRLQKARLGQGAYRANLLKVEPKCRLTGTSDPSFLIASHIKPWSACDTDEERMSRHNGFMLAPHVDKLFDRGWISFEDNGDLIVHDRVKTLLSSWGITYPANVGAFHPRQREFLKVHREEVFRNPKGLEQD